MSPIVRSSLLALILGATPFAYAQTLAKHGMAYKGAQGLTVLVAPTADEQKALVQINGVNAPIDGVVFLADKQTDGGRVSLRSPLDGRPWNLVRTEQRYDGTPHTVAFVPGLNNAAELSYDEKASKALNPETLKHTYEQQTKTGVQARLARFDRTKRIATQQAELARSDADATKTCAAPVQTEVDWAALSDDQLQRLSVAGYCAVVADAMRQLCGSDATFKASAASHSPIACSFGGKLRLRSEGGKTLFTTTEKDPNQDQFALQYLRNQ